jgi:hypothetical protein
MLGGSDSKSASIALHCIPALHCINDVRHVKVTLVCKLAFATKAMMNDGRCER